MENLGDATGNGLILFFMEKLRSGISDSELTSSIFATGNSSKVVNVVSIVLVDNFLLVKSIFVLPSAIKDCGTIGVV